jgi:UDP-N-acetylmuramate--alanine ligase
MPDAVVVSTAIPESDPELARARSDGLAVWARAQVLAALAAGRDTAAVTGTHGKTSTTSMLAVILERCGLDPEYVIGGDLNESGSNAKPGAGPFVAEADESDGSFLLLHPTVGVVTNVEADHLDFYGSESRIREAVADFMSGSRAVVVCGDDEGAMDAVRLAGVRATTYGVGDRNAARLSVESVPGWAGGGTLVLPSGDPVVIRMKVPGVHTLLNACAAVLAAGSLGVDAGEAAEALASFSGVRRRFEFRGTAGGAAFYDDYAHHPTEIAATLRAAADLEGHERLVAVFQPHRYTRTEVLWGDLGRSLGGADVVVVTDVYGAGEPPIPGISGKLLVDALADTGWRRRLVYLPRRQDVSRFLAEEAGEGDLVLTLGAGDITMVADETLERLRERE